MNGARINTRGSASILSPRRYATAELELQDGDVIGLYGNLNGGSVIMSLLTPNKTVSTGMDPVGNEGWKLSPFYKTLTDDYAWSRRFRRMSLGSPYHSPTSIKSDFNRFSILMHLGKIGYVKF